MAEIWTDHLKTQVSWARREVGSLKGHLANAEAKLERLKEELKKAQAGG